MHKFEETNNRETHNSQNDSAQGDNNTNNTFSAITIIRLKSLCGNAGKLDIKKPTFASENLKSEKLHSQKLKEVIHRDSEIMNTNKQPPNLLPHSFSFFMDKFADFFLEQGMIQTRKFRFRSISHPEYCMAISYFDVYPRPAFPADFHVQVVLKRCQDGMREDEGNLQEEDRGEGEYIMGEKEEEEEGDKKDDTKEDKKKEEEEDKMGEEEKIEKDTISGKRSGQKDRQKDRNDSGGNEVSGGNEDSGGKGDSRGNSDFGRRMEENRLAREDQEFQWIYGNAVYFTNNWYY